MFASNNGYNKAKEVVDNWLGQPVVTNKVASELTSEPAQQVEQFAGSGSSTDIDNVLDGILGDISVPTTQAQAQTTEATLSNLFTETLLEEYASTGEKGKELIDMLYLNPNWMDQDNFKKLNSLVYDVVMGLFEKEITRTASIKIDNDKEYSLGSFEVTNADSTHGEPYCRFYSYYLRDRLENGDCFKLMVTEPDSKTIYAGKDSAPFIQDTAAIKGFTTEATNIITKYNELLDENSEKMDAEVLTQLAEIVSSEETMGIENLYKEAVAWYELTWDSVSRLQKSLFVYGIVSMGSCGAICNTDYIRGYSSDVYQFCISSYDTDAITRTKPSTRYKNGGKTKEIIDRYFHRETAIEDLFRIIGYGCSDCFHTDFILGKQPLMNAIMNRQFFSNDRACKNQIIEKLLKALVIPMVPAKFGNVNVSRLAKKVDAGPYEAGITNAYGKFQYRGVLSKILPALFMTSWSEFMIQDLSEEAAKGFIKFVQSHEIYKALMRHAEDDDLSGLKEEINEPFVRNVVQASEFNLNFNPLYKEMCELFLDLSHFTGAVQIVTGMLMHKIIGAIKPNVVFGLSSSLIHVTKRINNMVFTLPIKATIQNDTAHIEGFFAKCKKEVPKLVKLLNPNNDKTILVLQDTPSGILTTGAPIAHAFPADIISSQEKLYKQRELLKESFYIIANTETYSAKELSALLSENRWKASLDKTDESFRRTLSKRLAQSTWESSLRMKQYTSTSYRYLHNHAEMFPSIIYTDKPYGYDEVQNFKVFNPYGVSLIIRGTSNNSPATSFCISDCKYELRSFKSSYSDDMTPEWWAYTTARDNSKHQIETIDSGIIIGHGTAVFSDGQWSHPETIRTGSFLRKLFSGKNKEKAFSENARICGSLVVPEFVPVDQPRPLLQTISRTGSPFMRGNTMPLYAQNLRYVTNDFGLEDAIAAANVMENEISRTIILDGDGVEPEPFVRVPLIKVDWFAICKHRDNDREDFPGSNALNRLRRVRTSDHTEDNGITLREFNYKYLCGTSRGMLLQAFSRDIQQGITLYQPLVSHFLSATKLTDIVKFLNPLRSFILSKKKVTHDLTRSVKALPEEEARPSDADIPLALQFEDQNRPCFLSKEERGLAGLRLAMEYNDSIKNNFRKDKLDPAKRELEKKQTEVARLQSMLRQEQRRVQELQVELEELEKRGTEAGLDRPDSLQNKLRRLILKGYILDYSIDNTGWLKLVVKAPNIWVGGLIYTFSPGIVKVPLDANSMSMFAGNESRLRVYALKDLLTVRLEAYKDFGSKYDVTSFSQLFRGESFLMTREPDNVNFFSNNGVIDYPHVRNGSGCLGGLISRFKQDVKEGDLANIITSVLYYMNTVNIRDSWGKGIRYWPAMPATMFNLLKCGLLSDMDEHNQQYIVIPGKSLVAGKDCPSDTWYKRWNTKEFPMAMIDVRDMNPEILYYLYQEASNIQENGYEHDYDYMSSYGKTRFSITTLGAECPYFSRISSKPNILYDTPIGDSMLTEALKFVSVMRDYAYNSYAPGTVAEQERDWKFLEHSIENIETWRSSIRKISSIEDGISNLEMRDGLTCKIELKDDKVIIGGN